MACADTTRLAVLIDADNATAGLARELLAEIGKYGTPTIKRACVNAGAGREVPWRNPVPPGTSAAGAKLLGSCRQRVSLPQRPSTAR